MRFEDPSVSSAQARPRPFSLILYYVEQRSYPGFQARKRVPGLLATNWIIGHNEPTYVSSAQARPRPFSRRQKAEGGGSSVLEFQARKRVPGLLARSACPGGIQ